MQTEERCGAVNFRRLHAQLIGSFDESPHAQVEIICRTTADLLHGSLSHAVRSFSMLRKRTPGRQVVSRTQIEAGTKGRLRKELNERHGRLHSASTRNQAFRLLWASNTISSIGDQFYFVALPWLILEVTGSSVVLGTVTMMAAIPRAALMLVGGAAMERPGR
jgi:hypothetical protein